MSSARPNKNNNSQPPQDDGLISSLVLSWTLRVLIVFIVIIIIVSIVFFSSSDCEGLSCLSPAFFFSLNVPPALAAALVVGGTIGLLKYHWQKNHAPKVYYDIYARKSKKEYFFFFVIIICAILLFIAAINTIVSLSSAYH